MFTVLQMFKIVASCIIICTELLVMTNCNDFFSKSPYICNIVNLTACSECMKTCMKKDSVCPKTTCTTPTPAARIEVTTNVSKQAQQYSYSILRTTISERAKMCGEYECQEKDKNLTGKRNDSIPDGFFLPNCGTIFVSDALNLITGNEHAKTCCALNLIHAAVTREDIQCLKNGLMEMQVKSNASRNLQNSIEQLFLVSARDVMLDHKFFTCPRADSLFAIRFLPGEPNNRFGTETCLAVNLREDIQGLDDVSCNVAMRFLCKKPLERRKMVIPYRAEVKQLSVKSLIAQCAKRNCTTNLIPTYNANGTVIVNSREGIMLPPCGNKQYFVSKENFKISSERKYSKCCQLGGVLAQITDRSHFACIAAHLKSIYGSNFNSYFLVQGEDIYYNQTFVMCPSMKRISDLAWKEGDLPNNLNKNERCVQLCVHPTNMGFDDISCSYTERYMCEFDVATPKT